MITQKDIKSIIFAALILTALHFILKPSKVEVQVEQDQRFNEYLLKDNERLTRENNQLEIDYEILHNAITQDSIFIRSIDKDSLRAIANRYDLH